MIATLGILGILGCGAIAVVGVIATVVATGTSVYTTYASNKAAEEAAEKNQQLQQEAMNKAENRSKADKIIQKRLTAKNLLQAQQSIGKSIAYEKLLTERSRRKAAKTNAEVGSKDGSSFKKAQFKNYSKGTPTAQA
jgi:hypothetical protein